MIYWTFTSPLPYSVSTSTDSVLPHDNTALTESQAHYTAPESSYSHTKRSMKGCTAVQYMLEWWLWELCGITLSIGSVVAVIALAINLDGTPLSDWKHGLSPNAIISALVTVAKTAMLFALAEGLSQTKWLHFWERQEPLGDISVYDDASRGPWGSLKLLRMGLRCKPSMIACAMGPVAQQIVVFDTQSVQQPGVNSSLIVTKTYSLDNDLESPTFINSQRAFQHALLDGLIKTNVPLGFTCQSGNCSWPNFSTLGLCSYCTDISNLTNATIIEGSGWGTTNVSFVTYSGSQFLYNPNPMIVSISQDVSSETHSYFLAKHSVELQIDTYYKNPDGIYLLKLTVWCARTYQKFSVVGFHPSILQAPFDYYVHEQPLEKLEVPSGVGEIAYYIPTPEDIWQHGTTSIYPFTDSIFLAPTSQSFGLFKHLVAKPVLQTSGADASVSGLAFRYGSNVSDRMQIVADSLTNWIQATQGSIEVQGTNSVQVTIISIDWAWLTLPIGLVISSAIVLVITVMCSRKNSVPVWKSSLMPLLFHGLEEWTIDERRDIRQGYWERNLDMQKKAQTIKVKLTRNDSGKTGLIRHQV
ncbi:hypothetical protein F5Y14DRAFT_437895 [Nemania sp. NC0429]|nr:hypothetical protein F5Y14DRAFT_437895 [Nemania sp. NC0429]